MHAVGLGVVALIFAASCAAGSKLDTRGLLDNLTTCREIEKKVSNVSTIYYPGAIEYVKDVYHQSASSSELSACSVQPGSAQDVGVILTIVGANRTPFAVKGGGHIMNAGFSSTPGVQISMSRFKYVLYDEKRGAASLGAGLIWDEVFAVLDPLGVTVAAARASGVGVAGFTLGGGFSFLSNQMGLAVDTVVEYELVLTNGTIRTITSADKDLFWALKGGGNNLGVVTKFVMKVLPYTQIWGGLMMTVGHREEVVHAILDFEANVNDPKASILPSFLTIAGVPTVGTILFYFAPEPPAGMFDAFLAIEGTVLKDIKTRSMGDLLASTAITPTRNTRGAYHTVTVEANDREFLDAVLAESSRVSLELLPLTGTFVGYHVEPFVAGYLLNPNRTSENSAFPYTRTSGMPVNIFFSWLLPTSDAAMHKTLKESVSRLDAAAGPKLPRYPNYSFADTPLEEMFGAEGTTRLRSVAQSVDPQKVMGLAGGFKV